MKFKQLLAARGIHFIVTRFGPAWLRGWAFDEKYRKGDWSFHGESGGELGLAVRRYLRKGDLLVMGCGGASILEGLELEGLNSALGVDLSDEAIRLASRYASEKISFQRADMVEFVSPRSYDVILFSESLNYVPQAKQVSLLRGLADHVKPGGVFIVTLAQAKRYGAVLDSLRRNFGILEDRAFSGSSRHLIVFQLAESQT